MSRPVLHTDRLTLRPFTLADAPQVQRLVSAYEVALNTLTIPHPYPEGGAVEWISRHDEDYEQDRIVHFAIEASGEVVGAIGLILKGDGVGELGYWVGVPYWGRGYVSEAARAVLQYGFEERKLRRIFACYLTRNPASGRVMEKIGMTYEGTMRRHVTKWDEHCDMAFYGMLREEWLSAQSSSAQSFSAESINERTAGKTAD